MRKFLAIILALACVAPAMAAGTITFGAPTLTTGQAVIPWTATEGVVGIGLTVDATGGNITGVVVASSPASFFDVFIDSMYTNSGYVVGQGIPTAKKLQAGELALPQASFSISVGGLDDTPGVAGDDPVTAGSITLTTAGTAPVNVVMAEDTLRGGVVAYSGAMAIAGASNLTFTIPGAVPTCRDRLTTAEKTLYDQYVAVGKNPSCWCNQFQCRGDANNDKYPYPAYRVYTADLNRLSASWKALISSVNVDPCADVAHDTYPYPAYRVYTSDLNLMASNWKKLDSQLTNCPGYVAP